MIIKSYIENYLSVNLADYENIGIDLEISKLLLLILIGLCISFFVIDWHRGYMLTAIKKLFRHEALDEESAKTLSELGLDRSWSVKWALSHDTRLSKIVKVAGAVEYTYEEYVALMKEKKKRHEKEELDKPDLSTAKFYISSKKLDEARDIQQNYSPSVIKTSLFSLMFIIIFVAITIIMPDILTFINSIIAP